MDGVYSRFESYHFEADARFLEGLNKFNFTLSPEELLKLRIFFYNKFVEPIDLPGYLENRPQSSTSHHSEENESSQNNHHSSAEVSQTNTDVQSVEDGPLSFVEVFRMIQAGEEIPGLKKLDIKACNQLPTVSQMSRKSKPWEK